MFEKYLKTKYDSLAEWINKNNIEAYRLYDRELSSYPLSIDVYGSFFHIYIYEKKDIQFEGLISETLNSLKYVFPKLLDTNLYFKIRKKQKEGSQYERLDQRKKRIIIQENNISYYINLTDYLDTGLFLDHRSTREIFSRLVVGKKRVLNLFSYTSAFSLVAAKSGVEYTTSVDMSNTYCEWARENIHLNRLDSYKHIVIRENVFFFLENIRTKKWKFDFIVIDPPTMSRSKKMLSKFDIQRDYPHLINASSEYLAENGTILFSTNFRKFKFEQDKIFLKNVQEISSTTIPIDFKDPKIHRVFLIKK